MANLNQGTYSRNINIKLSASDRNKLQRRMAKLHSLSTDEFRKITENLGATTVARMKRIAPVDTGHLVKNIKFETVTDGSFSPSKTNIEIQSNAEYSGHVDFGGHDAKISGRQIPFFYPTVKLAQKLYINRLKKAITKALRNL